MTTIWHDLEATMLLLVLLALMTGARRTDTGRGRSRRAADLGYQAAWARGEIGDRRAITPLLQALKHPDALARVNAIDSLERLRAQEAVPYLRKMVTDIAVPRAGPVIFTSEEMRDITRLAECATADPWESQVVTLRRVASGWEILRVVLSVV